MTGNTRPIAVLHVESDDELRELVRATLESAAGEFEIHTTADTSTASARLDEVDCVISAQKLPDGDGTELLKRVRQRNPDLPFILCVHSDTESVAKNAIDHDVTDYLECRSESTDLDQLADRIRAAVTDYRDTRQLEEMAERMDMALTATDSGLWQWDPETGRVIWDEHLEGLLGLEPGEFEGTFEAHAEYLHPEDRSLVEDAAQMALETNGEFVEQFRMVRADGEVIWVEGRGRLVASPESEVMVGLAIDITDQKQQKQALRDSEERYRWLLATAPSPIFIYSMDAELIFANEAAVEFLGAEDRDELLGSRVGEFTHPDSREAVEDRLDRLVNDRESVPQIEEKLVNTDGEVKHAILAAAPVTFDGEPAIQTVATDITAVKEREAELERQVERLDEFTSIVSHDLRNPLSVASGRVELAMEEYDSEDLERAANALDRMDTLIENLLSLARYGQQVQEVEPVSLARTAHGCWNTVSTEKAVLDIESDPMIEADESRLRQVLENLIGNAVEHAGPDVTVTVGAFEDGIYVADDGPGIPPEKRDQVFEHGHTSKPGGSGFGLTIVRQIAEAHDWSVRVTDADAGGTRIDIVGVEFVD